MLTITAIAHTYESRKGGRVAALAGVSFDAPAGAVTALVGPNGSGKSTLFRLITGTLPLQQGRLSFDGAPVRGARTGVVFQSPSLDDQLTVFENIACHAMLYGKKLHRKALPSGLLERLDLSGRLDTRIGELSGGYQRRVELAKALMTDPELLVLDEPFTGLDVQSRESFFAALQDLTAARGMTTLLITHVLSAATACEKVVVLEQGRVIADAAPTALLEEFGGTVVEITSSDAASLQQRLEAAGLPAARTGEATLLLRRTTLQDVLAVIDERDPLIEDLQARRPTLEDYFIIRTGHALTDAPGELLAA